MIRWFWHHVVCGHSQMVVDGFLNHTPEMGYFYDVMVECSCGATWWRIGDEAEIGDTS